MASVDRDVSNSVGRTTSILAAPTGRVLFDREIVFVADAWPVFAFQFPIFEQDLDAAYGRGLNRGRGVVGEGGDGGPGVVGIAGGTVTKNAPREFPRSLADRPQPGRGLRVGVIGTGRLQGGRPGETVGIGNAIGVLGDSDKSVGVFGVSDEHAGVYGKSPVTGVVGDGGHIGVEGSGGDLYGVYGHVNFKAPSADMIGVFGAAALNLADPKTHIGRAGVFVGPVEVVGDSTITGDLVVWGSKSAAARHDDGTDRLLYCVESPDSQFEDFGEAKLVNGRAEVRLDPDFMGVADTRNYHVFLTPYGNSQGLYVAARRRNGFQVMEQGGGSSRLTFSYRVVAKRKHVITKRFKKVARPEKPKIPSRLDPPEVDLRPRNVARVGEGKRAGKKGQRK